MCLMAFACKGLLVPSDFSATTAFLVGMPAPLLAAFVFIEKPRVLVKLRLSEPQCWLVRKKFPGAKSNGGGGVSSDWQVGIFWRGNLFLRYEMSWVAIHGFLY